MNCNSLDMVLEVPVENKLVDVSTHSRLLEQRISKWLGADYQFIGNVIGTVEELGSRIELTDEYIGDLSFRCLNKRGEILNIELSYAGEMEQDRIFSIINDVDEKTYQLMFEGNTVNLLLTYYKRLKKPIKRIRKFEF